MKLSFQCLGVTHTSGRVTLTPLELPELAVHADTLDEARFELTLALDDRISRAHPRHLWRYARPGAGELFELAPVLLPVQRAQGANPSPLPLLALIGKGHGGYVELRLPRLPARYWAKGKEAQAELSALAAEGLRRAKPDELLSLRKEGTCELVELTLDVHPLKLRELRRKELHLDERAPPRPKDVEDPDAFEPEPPHGEDDEPDEDLPAPPLDDEDDWSERPRGAKAKKEPKKVPTPTLNSLGAKWHLLAKEGAFPPAFFRQALVEQVRTHLLGKEPEPLVLVGPSGVGKTAILQELAQRLAAEATAEAPARPFFFLDGSRLIAGTGMFGDWQRQTLDSFAEAREAKALLHLGRLIDLLDAGKSAHSDDNVAQLLLPNLASREVPVVTEATAEEWARVQARHHSFSRLFTPLVVEEPSPADLGKILTAVAAREAEETARIRPDAIDEIRSLVRRFRPYGSTLGSCVTFLRRLTGAALHRLEDEVTRADVIRAFSTESGVPEELLRDEVKLDVDEVRAFLAARVIGQREAVDALAPVVTAIKANLTDPKRPVGALLFVGPTGVGKTELSKALAERVFGSRDRLLRFDMGEYAGPDALARLIGDERSEGQLTAAVRRQPFCVVLLDELEKAHPVVFDLLLGVLGEGRLTDARGRLADFRSAVVVMTSNLGAQTLRAQVGFSDEGGAARSESAHYLAEVRRFFRPELFNRLDEVVVFSALGPEALSEIVHREVDAVTRRAGLSRLDVQLDVDGPTRAQLAAQGFDPRYGARPLKRVLERELVAKVAAQLAEAPPKQSSRMEARLHAGTLWLKLHPLSKQEEGVSRAAILEVYERAADLRAEVTAWARCPTLRGLAQSLELFDRMSRLPSFWEDRALAEEQSRRAGLARELVGKFKEVHAQAEAAEELVFDAYHARSVRSAMELEKELALTREALHPLTVQLYASLFPPVKGGTLTLLPGRGAWTWAEYLLNNYRRWLGNRDVRSEVSYLMPLTKHEREREEARAEEARKKKLPYEVPSHAWKEGIFGNGPPLAAAMHLHGDKALMMLAAEHGAHRFHLPGESFQVRVRFEPMSRQRTALPLAEQLDSVLPANEIRRLWPLRKDNTPGLVKDLRTETEHRADEADFNLAALLTDYVRMRVLGEEAPE